MSNIDALQNPISALPLQLKPLPDPQYIWDFSMGADFSTIVCSEPDVRIKATGAKGDPGRTIGVQKKNPRRNTIDFRDPIDGKIKRAEGSLEMKGLYQDFRDPRVSKIEVQHGPCPYMDRDGKQRYAYWDARITYDDGRVLLKDFKPAAIAAKKNHAQTVEDIFLQMPRSMADEVRLITDRDLPRWAVANGRLIHSVLCDGKWVMLQEMRAAALALTDNCTVEGFCLPFGGVQRTFRTAVYLIAKRELWHKPGLIVASTPIGPVARGHSRPQGSGGPLASGPAELVAA